MKHFLYDWWFILAFVTGFLIFVYWIITDTVKNNRIGNEVKNYCGYVIDKGYDTPSSGHKSHTEAQYWIVLRDEDCYKAIRVHVTPSTFYSTEKDKRICFSISAFELRWYGNTNEVEHLK